MHIHIYIYIAINRATDLDIRCGGIKRALDLVEGILGAAFTRYSFTCVWVQESIIPLLPPTHLHCPHYCNTIARLLREKRLLPDPPFVSHTPYHIGHGNIV